MPTKREVDLKFEHLKKILPESYHARIANAQNRWDALDKRNKDEVYKTNAVLVALEEILFKIPNQYTEWGICPAYDLILIRQKDEKADFLFQYIS